MYICPNGHEYESQIVQVKDSLYNFPVCPICGEFPKTTQVIAFVMGQPHSGEGTFTNYYGIAIPEKPDDDKPTQD